MHDRRLTALLVVICVLTDCTAFLPAPVRLERCNKFRLGAFSGALRWPNEGMFPDNEGDKFVRRRRQANQSKSEERIKAGDGKGRSEKPRAEGPSLPSTTGRRPLPPHLACCPLELYTLPAWQPPAAVLANDLALMTYSTALFVPSTSASPSTSAATSFSPPSWPGSSGPSTFRGRVGLRALPLLTNFLLKAGASHAEISAMSPQMDLTFSVGYRLSTPQNPIWEALMGQSMWERRPAEGKKSSSSSAEAASSEAYLKLLQSGSLGGASAGNISDKGAQAAKALRVLAWEQQKRHLLALIENGFTGSDLVYILGTWPTFLSLETDSSAHISQVCTTLRDLGLRQTQLRRMVKQIPQVMVPRKDGSTIADTIKAFGMIGFKGKSFLNTVMQHPSLILHPPLQVFLVSSYMMSKQVRIKRNGLGSLYRKAPWLLDQNVEDMRKVGRWLTNIGIKDMEQVFRAHPEVLLQNVKQTLDRVYNFLVDDSDFDKGTGGGAGLDPEDVPQVLELFPRLLSAGMPEHIDRVRHYMRSVGIPDQEVPKVVKAFPSILTLDIEDMQQVVGFLRGAGMESVGEMLTRLPSILGYSVSAIAPKLEYFTEYMDLEIEELERFPAFFSYPLETIQTRTEFLAILGNSISGVGLRRVLTPSDDDFSKKVVKVNPKFFQLFKNSYLKGGSKVKVPFEAALKKSSVP